MPTDEYKVVIRAPWRPVGEHERRYNAPTVDEVAVVMVAEEFNKRDIIIQRRSENLQRISETHMMPCSILSYFGKERMAITSI
jgi:hypothetical protein